MNDNTKTGGDPAINRWAILRTAGPRTLPLVKSLEEAGFEVWTPRGWRFPKKVPLLPSRRQLKAAMEWEPVAYPIVPTFVFAQADRLPDLVRLSHDALSEHPAYSVFRYYGRIPLIADRALNDLRRFDQKPPSAPKPKPRRRVEPGQRISFSEGAFAGMEGVVEEQKGQFAVVAFGGGLRMKIAAWRDEFDDVQGDTAQLGAAA